MPVEPTPHAPAAPPIPPVTTETIDGKEQQPVPTTPGSTSMYLFFNI